MKIAIIGAGASGCVAAINLKRLNNDIKVDIYEQNKTLAKKVLLSGNGKCNISNIYFDGQKYNNYSVIEKINQVIPNSEVINFIESIGVKTVVDSSGRIYPTSKSGASLIRAFTNELKLNHCNLFLNCKITDFLFDKNKVTIIHDGNNYDYDYLFICCGGVSYSLGNSFKLIEILKNKKIAFNPLKPSITGFSVIKDQDKLAKSIRVKAKVSLYDSKTLIAITSGEIQFKDKALSGICIMELSSYYNWYNTQSSYFYLNIDFFEELSLQEIINILNCSLNKNLTYNEILPLIIHQQLSDVILKNNNFTHVNIENNRIIAFLLKNYLIRIDGLLDFSYAQVMNGGVLLSELNNDLSLKKNQKIYFCGEILDIDGLCGGYNLHFAFLSALYASYMLSQKLPNASQ